MLFRSHGSEIVGALAGQKGLERYVVKCAVRDHNQFFGRRRSLPCRGHEQVEQALAALAIAAFEAGIRRFVVAGGETSGAVAQALGLSRLDIGAEIAPGVPWTFSRVRGEDIAITLKSGNFGDGDFFATALARLEE